MCDIRVCVTQVCLYMCGRVQLSVDTGKRTPPRGDNYLLLHFWARGKKKRRYVCLIIELTSATLWAFGEAKWLNPYSSWQAFFFSFFLSVHVIKLASFFFFLKILIRRCMFFSSMCTSSINRNKSKFDWIIKHLVCLDHVIIR